MLLSHFRDGIEPIMRSPLTETALQTELKRLRAENALLWRELAAKSETSVEIVQMVRREICAAHGISWIDLVGESCTRDAAAARRECARRLRAEYGWSLPRIGRLLNRDHSSIGYMLTWPHRTLREAKAASCSETPQAAVAGDLSQQRDRIAGDLSQQRDRKSAVGEIKIKGAASP
jgi:hypothetical protein